MQQQTRHPLQLPTPRGVAGQDACDLWIELRREFSEIRALAWMPN
jgi:hypothetical protein